MQKKQLAELIKNAIYEDRASYASLTDQERRLIIAHLLAESEQGLIDADDRQLIQKAVADVILDDGSQESLLKLKETIEVAFLRGDKEYDPHYAEDIQGMLDDEWNERNSRPNEHFENDAMQRARDIQDAQRRMNSS